MLLLLHPLGVVFDLVGPEDQLVWAAVKLVGDHLLEMLADPEGNTQKIRALKTDKDTHPYFMKKETRFRKVKKSG